MTDQGPQVYLIHGSDEVRVHRERARLVSELVPLEHRAENLTEIEPPGNRLLSLRQIAADLMAELATPSFFPETRRVVVVEQLGDLLGTPGADSESDSQPSGKRSRKKAPDAGTDPVQGFCRFLERDLPQTSNVLILTAVEEPDKRRRIRTTSLLYKTIQSVGRVLQFNEPAVIFRFLDAFSNRDMASALRALPELLTEEEGAGSVYRMLARQVRFLIQAKLLERSAGTDVEEFARKYLPPEKGLNLMLEHPFAADKTRRAASRWTMSELNSVLARLEEMTKVIYPSSRDTYVPDSEVELERFVFDACSPAVPALAK